MKVELIPAPKLRHDPYEEDCSGAHSGESITVSQLDDGLELSIRELRTGLGPQFSVYLLKDKAEVFYFRFCISDDGELIVNHK